MLREGIRLESWQKNIIIASHYVNNITLSYSIEGSIEFQSASFSISKNLTAPKT